MPRLLSHFHKPEFAFRPTQVWRRLRYSHSWQESLVRLPWHASIWVTPSEHIGFCLATQGVYGLAETETLFRLTDIGETAIDVGANIGYMTIVLARAVGPAGTVLSFEPNPLVLPKLRRNLEFWAALGITNIRMDERALSDSGGMAQFYVPEDSRRNEGLGSLEFSEGRSMTVAKCRLDELLRGQQVGVMKIDVEGHEAVVLEGASSLLRSRHIRDILFEEHRPYPARSHQLLEEAGYSVFRLSRSFWHPLLLAPETKDLPGIPNYVATVNPARAFERFSRAGWQSLRDRCWER